MFQASKPPSKLLPAKRKSLYRAQFLRKFTNQLLLWSYKVSSIMRGRKSIFFVLIFIVGFLGLSLIAPTEFEILLIPEESNSLMSTLLSTYVGVLSFAIAVSAIILSILQMANRKIVVTDLIFRKSFFAPTFYFGVVNIVILTVLQLFNTLPTERYVKFLSDRILVSEFYLFAIFSFAIIYMLYQVFRALNFSNLVDDYLKDVLRTVRLQSFQKNKETDFQKISLKRKEMFQEIEFGIEKKDEIIVEKFLTCFLDAAYINRNSSLLFALNLQLSDWIIASNERFEPLNKLITFWRRYCFYFSLHTQPDGFYLKALPAQVYKAYKERKYSTKISEYFDIRLKEMIKYEVNGFEAFSNITEEQEKQIKNILSCFNLLLMEICTHLDGKNLKHALNQLHQLIGYPSLFNRNRSFLSENSDDGLDLISNDTLRKKEENFSKRVSSISMGIYYMILFTKEYNSKQEALEHEILEILRQYSFTTFHPIELTLSNLENPYLEDDWDNWLWHIEDRLDGKGYTLPSTIDLLSVGLTAHLLLSDQIGPEFQNKNYSSNQLSYLVEACQKSLDLIKNDAWCSEFKGEINVLEKRKDAVRAYLSALKTNNELERLKEIVQSKIDPERVNLFKEKIKEQWLGLQNISEVFEYFGAIEVNPSEQLTQLHPNIFVVGMREFFTNLASNESLHVMDAGVQLERNKEQLFVQRLKESLKSRVVTHDPDIVDGLDKAIKRLRANSFKPNIILTFDINFYTLTGTLDNSGRYTPKRKANKKIFPFDYEGLFDEIPVTRLYAPGFENLIIVAELSKAIKMLQRENDLWIQNRLSIEVKGIEEEEVGPIFDKRKAQFGESLTEMVRYKILASMTININEICDFKIVDMNAWVALQIR